MKRPIELLIMSGVISGDLKIALKSLEDRGELKVLVTDDEPFTPKLNELKRKHDFVGRFVNDKVKRNKSDRKRAPKWGRR